MFTGAGTQLSWINKVVWFIWPNESDISSPGKYFASCELNLWKQLPVKMHKSLFKSAWHESTWSDGGGSRGKEKRGQSIRACFVCPALDECCTFAPVHRPARTVWFAHLWRARRIVQHTMQQTPPAKGVFHSCTLLLNTALCCSQTIRLVVCSNNALQNN